MDMLYRSYRMLLSNTSTDFIRYLHDEVEQDNKLIVVSGSRGVGKTTMLLQHIKLCDNIDETLPVIADDLYFVEHKLIDLAIDFYQHGGKKPYIDKVHKYVDWARKIKNIYDLIPRLQVMYIGPSILGLEVGEADLGRGKLEYRMVGSSFREYLAISYGYHLLVYSLEDTLGHKIDFPYAEACPILLLREYPQHGYYPFFQGKGYLLRLRSIIKQTLENSTPTLVNINVTTASKLKRLPHIITKSVPFKPIFTKLATLFDMNKNTASDLICYLEKAGIINQLRAETEDARPLGKVDEVYLNNTNLAHALSDNIPDISDVRETFLSSTLRVVCPVTTSDVFDLMAGGYTFKVGRKNKSQKQMHDMENVYVVKNDIECGMRSAVPLRALGFLY